MLDKWGFVWRAPEDGKGSYALEKEPLAQLGPGRPLGFHFDEEGNLIVCNAGSVRSFLCQPIMFPWREGDPALLPRCGFLDGTRPDLQCSPVGGMIPRASSEVCVVALQGLVMLEKGSNKVVLLTSRVSADDPLDPESPIDYANDVTVASNGIIYFTDSVQGIMPRRNWMGFWDTMEAYMLTLFQVRPPSSIYLLPPQASRHDAPCHCVA